MFQGIALGFGGIERLVLLDPKAGEHGHVETVALVDRFLLDDLVQAFPVCEAPRLGAGPGFACRGEQFGLGRLDAFGVRVHLELLDQCLAFGRVRVEHTETCQHVHGFRLGQVIFTGIGRRLGARWQYQVLAALAFVRTGLAHVDDRPLPEITNTARSRAGWQFDHQRPGFVEVDEAEDVWRGGIGGDHAELVFVTVEHHQVAAAGAQLVAELFLPLRVRHQRQRPEVTLSRLLEIQFDIQSGNGFMGRQFALHGDFADTGVQVLGTDPATDEHGHQAETGCANGTVHRENPYLPKVTLIPAYSVNCGRPLPL
ncbi:hypothetical protein D3C84_615800 [compost metagenome]